MHPGGRAAHLRRSRGGGFHQSPAYSTGRCAAAARARQGRRQRDRGRESRLRAPNSPAPPAPPPLYIALGWPVPRSAEARVAAVAAQPARCWRGAGCLKVPAARDAGLPLARAPGGATRVSSHSALCSCRPGTAMRGAARGRTETQVGGIGGGVWLCEMGQQLPSRFRGRMVAVFAPIDLNAEHPDAPRQRVLPQLPSQPRGPSGCPAEDRAEDRDRGRMVVWNYGRPSLLPAQHIHPLAASSSCTAPHTAQWCTRRPAARQLPCCCAAAAAACCPSTSSSCCLRVWRREQAGAATSGRAAAPAQQRRQQQ
jgi:hypothetical protein